MTCNKACTNMHNDKPCAVATFYAECEGVMPMPTGCSMKAPPDPARQPFPELDDDETPVTGSELLLIFAIVSICVAAVAGVIWQVSPF